MNEKRDPPTEAPPAKPAATATTPAPTSPHGGGTLDEEWLRSFYHECGREVTLAYTTLNQMKNWAMLVTAAAISGLAFSTSASNYPTVEMLIGVVVVYTFTLRFFIRAMISYINLVKWNELQNDCVQLMLVPKKTDGTTTSQAERNTKLVEDIQHHYHQWLSPLSRKNQLLQNLKLGFALILSLPLFFMVWGVFALWNKQIVRGLAVFAIGDTVVEFNDFLKSRYFNNVEADKRAKSRGKFYEIFPVPATDEWFLISWVLVLLLSILVATWPTIWPWIVRNASRFVPG